jgi:hypothetical protein
MHNEPEATVPEQTLEQIAQRHLGVPTLATRKSDQLDFHDLAVWTLREALAAAYEAGRAAGRRRKIS